MHEFLVLRLKLVLIEAVAWVRSAGRLNLEKRAVIVKKKKSKRMEQSLNEASRNKPARQVPLWFFKWACKLDVSLD